MIQTFHIETFGCQMNELDSEKVAGALIFQGLQPVHHVKDADLVILNTCSVREKAVQKILSRLGELRPLKKQKKDLVVAVMGCVAQQEGDHLIQKSTVVDLVVGTHQIHHLAALLDDFQGTRKPLVLTDQEKGLEPAEHEHIFRKAKYRAYVSIQEGCNKYCSFCIVPFTRGREKNRPSQLILNEIKMLANEGCLEIILLGQNVNSYLDPSTPSLEFCELLRQICSIPGIRRVRFTSPHPADFNSTIVKVIEDNPVLCNQIHLPLQSGSTEVLSKMRRGYTQEDYLKLVSEIQSSSRIIELSTDIIVGFPGETENDFQKTMQVIEEVRFNSIYSFLYSPRPFTTAAKMKDPIPTEQKKEWLQHLQKRQKEIQLVKNNQYLHKTVEVLVDGFGRQEQQLSARTTENICVNFHCFKPIIGNFVNVFIKESYAHSLIGEYNYMENN
jgi:tRNA-2-methylthio-N6-dimethylallyladenosine synthase